MGAKVLVATRFPSKGADVFQNSGMSRTRTANFDTSSVGVVVELSMIGNWHDDGSFPTLTKFRPVRKASFFKEYLPFSCEPHFFFLALALSDFLTLFRTFFVVLLRPGLSGSTVLVRGTSGHSASVLFACSANCW